MHLIKSVPCRHHMEYLSAGDLWEIFDVRKIVPAIMPAKGFHDAFCKWGKWLRFQFW